MCWVTWTPRKPTVFMKVLREGSGSKVSLRLQALWYSCAYSQVDKLALPELASLYHRKSLKALSIFKGMYAALTNLNEQPPALTVEAGIGLPELKSVWQKLFKIRDYFACFAASIFLLHKLSDLKKIAVECLTVRACVLSKKKQFVSWSFC